MPPPPRSATAGDGTSAYSRITIIGAAATGSQLLEIKGYSHTKEQLPTGCAIFLPPFSVGGHSWELGYYPNNEISEFADFITISILCLEEPGLRSVRAHVTLSLLDQAGEPVPSRITTTGMHDFTDIVGISFHDFINRAWLEESEYLVDDCFTIRCDVVVPLEVRKEDRAAEPPPAVTVPPSDLHQHLGALLAAKEGTDVTFQVAGEAFCAHRCVLAARSPVFKAELFGAMKEGTTAAVRVDDMEADVFRALLYFVYTDTLQDCNGVNQQKEAAMAQHLLVAADRYNLDRLKQICEEKLCKHIGTSSVVTILALTEQHNCSGLKKACLHFLSSSSNLGDVMATDGFEHLARSRPSIMKELIFNFPARAPVNLGEASRVDMGRHGMFSSGRRTKNWYLVLVLLAFFLALSLKGGNTPLACLCSVAAFFMGTITH